MAAGAQRAAQREACGAQPARRRALRAAQLLAGRGALSPRACARGCTEQLTAARAARGVVRSARSEQRVTAPYSSEQRSAAPCKILQRRLAAQLQVAPGLLIEFELRVRAAS